MKAEENDLVSIIIPVYNVEAYVKRCIISVQRQTYKNIEVIIVDDGSTDASKAICDDIAAQDERLFVIHKPNGGLSSTRNAGIKAARGKYVAFVDSDDFVHVEYISVMHKIAVETGAEIVICDYERGKKSGFSIEKSDTSYNLYTSIQMLENWHSDFSTLETIACNKLILRDVFVKIDFHYPEGVFYEDIRTTHLLVDAADIIAVTGRKLYYYYQRKNSITKQLRNEKNIKDNLIAHDIRIDFFVNRGYESAVHRLMIGRQKHYMLMLCLTNSREIKKELKIRFRNSYKSLIEFREITWIEKVMFYFFKIIFIRYSFEKEQIDDIQNRFL